MAVTTSIKVTGLSETLKTLRSLPPEIVSRRGGPVRAALRKAAVVIQKEAQANVDRIVQEPNKGGLPSKSTGALKQAITVRRRKPLPGTNGEVFTVGISPIKRRYSETRHNVRKRRVGKEYFLLPPTYYAWFLEFGTKRMQPHPFMRPAFEAKKEEAVSVFQDELDKNVAKIVKKLGLDR